MLNAFNRRDFSLFLAALMPALSATKSATAAQAAPRSDDSGVSRANEAIHQDIMIEASPQRVYTALTDTNQFDKIIQLSGAMQKMSLGTAPTKISRSVGGVFVLFGGHIFGRHIELVPGKRIVQAWRAASWNPGAYSMVKFELMEQNARTKLAFDHTGFPNGEGPHLAEGWKVNYWVPLTKFLA